MKPRHLWKQPKRRAWLSHSTTPIARSAIKPKRRTAAEQREKFDREFGGDEYLAFVKARPCCACGIEGYAEAAHVGKEGAGTGRKADGKGGLAPLCGPHNVMTRISVNVFDAYFDDGCHRELHQHGVKTFEANWNISLAAECARVAAQWQAREEGR